MSWSVVALILLAAGLGLRHAVAPDHLAAVSTFVKASRARTRRSVQYALQIGGGHALGMLIMAVVILVAAHALPRSLIGALSRISGLWLMLLSLWIILDWIWPNWRFGMQQLTRFRDPAVAPNPAPKRRIGVAAWGIGLLFGIAVSPGDLAIFTLALGQASNPVLALSLFLTFLLAMLCGLAAVGIIMGFRGSGVRGRVSSGLTGLSGFFGFGVGFMLVAGFLH